LPLFLGLNESCLPSVLLWPHREVDPMTASLTNLWQHLGRDPSFESFGLGQFGREDQCVESRLVDDYFLSLVVRTSALNQGSGFIVDIYMCGNSASDPL